MLSALATGHVTITAGNATADITVYAGSLPVGTPVWSVPVSGNLVPAVPSSTGVADVFAISGQTISAITSDGVVAWTSTAGGAANKRLADFQGGLIVWRTDESIVKLNGMTGR